MSVFIFFKIHRDKLAISFFTCVLVGVCVVFVAVVKYVVNEWVAQNKVYLSSVHARLKLIQHVLGDNVALLDVDFIDTRE